MSNPITFPVATEARLERARYELIVRYTGRGYGYTNVHAARLADTELRRIVESDETDERIAVILGNVPGCNNGCGRAAVPGAFYSRCEKDAHLPSDYDD